MKKTVAIIATADTKMEEMNYLKRAISEKDIGVLVIDISTRGGYQYNADITPAEVVSAGGNDIDDVLHASKKSEAISLMKKGIVTLLPKLYEQGRIDGVIAVGGAQNSLMTTSAMQQLPIGVPKVILSSLACGARTCGSFTGYKDVVIIPSIADLTGINAITKTMLNNAAATVIGMIQLAGKRISKSELQIGATLLGATQEGIIKAIKIVQENGYKVISFSASGVGGRAMDILINEGVIWAAMDLTPHEIVCQDVIKAGYSYGQESRLTDMQRIIPMVVTPAGLDFVDFLAKDFFSGALGDFKKRKYTFHNPEIVHIKLFPEEASRAAKIISERLNKIKGKTVMVFPKQGLRTETKPGELMYDPDVDAAIFDTLRKNLKKDIEIFELDAHIADIEFSRKAAYEMIRLIKETYSD